MPFSSLYLEIPMIIIALVITFHFSHNYLGEHAFFSLLLAITAAIVSYFIYFCLEFVRKGLVISWEWSIIEILFAIALACSWIIFGYKLTIILIIKARPNHD
jgi:hypothetical protein